MPDPITTAERYRKVAAEAFDLAKDAVCDFVRRYREGIAERYLLLTENKCKGRPSHSERTKR
jgi:hypothetical protein